ncbi:DNA adenine methylase [Candidatus Poriferisodalis sp.]|uniref:DNA adenine methylase n=1 Tax=Candidatus Poriferisodalis sp. TaxID=3101277 RepID=UPI003B5BDC52
MVPRLPARFGTYYEPFLGAGSLFFLLEPPRAVLSDSNMELIETYRAVRDNPQTILRHLADFDPMDRDAYYRVRDSNSLCRFQSAARFIYLNRACWNGLYRVNSQGKFNVPYGAPSTSNIVDASVLLACSAALSHPGVDLLHADFEIAIETSSAGDLVFLDPPYVTGHNNNGFIDYNEKLFSWADQCRLARMASHLQRAGQQVLVTNAYHPNLLALYPRFNFDVLSRYSTLAGNGSRRKPIEEVLLWQRSPHCE